MSNHPMHANSYTFRDTFRDAFHDVFPWRYVYKSFRDAEKKINLLIIQQTEKCLLLDPPSSVATETYILFAR